MFVAEETVLPDQLRPLVRRRLTLARFGFGLVRCGRLIQDPLLDVDRAIKPQCESDSVRGARVEQDRIFVHVF